MIEGSMGKRSKRVLICALIAVGSGIAGLLLSNVRFFQVLNAKTYDLHFLVRGQQPTHDIFLIRADEEALRRFEDDPIIFWHKHYADMIRAAGLGGAKVMGLDHAFGLPVEKWAPGYDSFLGEAAITAPMPVVVAYATVLNAATRRERERVPINLMAAGLGLNGFANLTADSVDDFIRKQELLAEPVGSDPPEHSFALRVTEKFLGVEAVASNGILMLGNKRVPIDEGRSIYINYAGGPKTFPGRSMAEVEAALQENRVGDLRQWFNGKIVLVGTDFQGDSDRKNTPFFTLLSTKEWTTAGVEIHANTVQTLLDENPPRMAPQWLRIGSVLAATAATAAAVVSVSAGASGPALLAIGFIVALATHVLFRYGVILSTSEIMIAATICLIASVIYRRATADRRGDLFHEAISLFVGKRVAASLEDTRSIGLTGKRQTVTILFTDIRGFTAYTEQICDDQGPEFLVKKLNEYMGTMAAIIVSFGGHVNKYIGDGILAVFADDDEGAREPACIPAWSWWETSEAPIKWSTRCWAIQ
jgi:adenylate cyclase